MFGNKQYFEILSLRFDLWVNYFHILQTFVGVEIRFYLFHFLTIHMNLGINWSFISFSLILLCFLRVVLWFSFEFFYQF
jgi:hypothetical protein